MRTFCPGPAAQVSRQFAQPRGAPAAAWPGRSPGSLGWHPSTWEGPGPVGDSAAAWKASPKGAKWRVQARPATSKASALRRKPRTQSGGGERKAAGREAVLPSALSREGRRAASWVGGVCAQGGAERQTEGSGLRAGALVHQLLGHPGTCRWRRVSLDPRSWDSNGDWRGRDAGSHRQPAHCWKPLGRSCGSSEAGQPSGLAGAWLWGSRWELGFTHRVDEKDLYWCLLGPRRVSAGPWYPAPL